MKKRFKQVLTFFFLILLKTLKLIVSPLSFMVFFILSFFREIKIVPLFSSRIGHYVGNTEIFISDLQNPASRYYNPNNRVLYIYIHIPPISNKQIEKMIKRETISAPYFLFSFLLYLLARYDKTNKYWINLEEKMDRDAEDSIYKCYPNFGFTSKEHSKGVKLLDLLGIQPDKYVVLHVRDSNYLKTIFPEADFSYHDYRDTNIMDYQDMCDALVSKGLKVVRIGKHVGQSMNYSSQDIIDYAMSEFCSDFADVYLASKCKFFISNSSGIDATASIFRKPNIWVNYPNISYPKLWDKNHCVAYRVFRDSESNAFLSIDELYKRNAHNFWSKNEFIRAKIELDFLSSKDLKYIVIEFNEYLDNNFHLTDDDQKIQNIFWNKFQIDQKIHNQNEIRCIISPYYLRSNIDFLGN